MIDDIKAKFTAYKIQKKIKKNGVQALDDTQPTSSVDEIINSTLDDIVEGIIEEIEVIDANDATNKKIAITNIILIVGCIIYLVVDKLL